MTYSLEKGSSWLTSDMVQAVDVGLGGLVQLVGGPGALPGKVLVCHHSRESFVTVHVQDFHRDGELKARRNRTTIEDDFLSNTGLTVRPVLLPLLSITKICGSHLMTS